MDTTTRKYLQLCGHANDCERRANRYALQAQLAMLNGQHDIAHAFNRHARAVAHRGFIYRNRAAALVQ